MTSLATGLMNLSFPEMGKAAVETGLIWGLSKNRSFIFFVLIKSEKWISVIYTIDLSC